MTDEMVEKVARAIRKHVRTEIGQDWDGMTYTLSGVDEAAREIAAIEAAEAGAVPVAWRYELAGAVTAGPDGSKIGSGWTTHIHASPPCVPDWGVRNLTPLYTSPRSEASREAIRKEAFEEAAWVADARAETCIRVASDGYANFARSIATAIRARGET